VNDIEIYDFNNDGNLDAVLGGNLLNSEVETPRSDACYGWLLLGDGKGKFEVQDYVQSGLYNPYETRKIKVVKMKEDKAIIFANNNQPMTTFRVNPKKK
jgi:hypothetical protein